MFPDGSQASREATNTQSVEKEKSGWIASRELGSTNEIETKEILTTSTTIYTMAKVSLPYTTIVNETERQ